MTICLWHILCLDLLIFKKWEFLILCTNCATHLNLTLHYGVKKILTQYFLGPQRAKFHQNRTKIATVGVRTDRQTDRRTQIVL